MSYSTKKKYTSRRERGKIITKGIKRIFIFVILGLGVLFFQNRVSIINYLHTYFY